MPRTVLVKVYLNEGPDNYFGFHNPFADEPRLRLAAVFDLEIDGPLQADMGRELEMIFHQLNVGGDQIPATPWCRRYREERNRSLSVGDVVVIGETAWSVESVGWGRVSTDELIEAIAAYNLKGAHVRA